MMISNLRTLLHILLLHSMAATTNFFRRRIHKDRGFPGLWMPRMEMPSFKLQAHLMSLQRKMRLLPGPRSRTALDKQGRSLLRFSYQMCPSYTQDQRSLMKKDALFGAVIAQGEGSSSSVIVVLPPVVPTWCA